MKSFSLRKWTALALLSLLAVSAAPGENKKIQFSEGSPLEQEFLARLEGYCLQENLSHQRHDFTDFQGAHSFSSLLEVTFPGARNQQLILLFPLSNLREPETAAPELGLALLKALQQRTMPLPCGITLLFAGAEEGRPDQRALGSELFLQDYYPGEPTALLSFGITEDPKEPRLVLTAAGRGRKTPSWWLLGLRDIFHRTEITPDLQPGSHLLLGMGFSQQTPRLEPWLKKDIPSLLIEGNPSLSPDRWLSLILEAGSLDFAPPDEDHHYLILPEAFPGPPLIGEKTILQIISITLGLLLLFLFTLPRLIRRNLIHLLKRVWTLPLFLVLGFLILSTATILIRALLELREIPTLWQSNAPLFFLLKFLIAILLFSLSYPLLRRFTLSRSSYFYTFSAAVTASFTSLVLLSQNMILALPHILAVILMTLFSITRRRRLKVFYFILSPLGLLTLGYAVFSARDWIIIETILISPVQGNIILTIILMPFFLILSSLHFSRPRMAGKKARTRSLFLTAGWGLISLGLVSYIMLFKPYLPGEQPLEIHDFILMNQQQRSIIIKSPAPLPDLTLQTEEGHYRSIQGQRTTTIIPRKIPRLLRGNHEVSSYLDRKKLNLDLEFWGSPAEIKINLSSGEPIIIYDAPFPYENSLDQRRAAFFIGRYPPNPLNFSFSLADIKNLTIELELIYDAPPYELKILDSGYQMDKKTRYRETISIDLSETPEDTH